MLSHRAQQLEKVSFELEMSFDPRDEWGLINYLRDFRLFRRGFGKRISNILHRQDAMLDLDVHIFDYRYTISSGNSSRVIRQTVFFVNSQQLGLPQFFLRPENFFHRIGEYLGMQDIDFAAFPRFSRNYLLDGQDEDFIRASLSEPFLHFFSIEKDWYLEGINYYLIFYRKGELLPPEKIKAFYQQGMNIFRMLAEK